MVRDVRVTHSRAADLILSQCVCDTVTCFPSHGSDRLGKNRGNHFLVTEHINSPAQFGIIDFV